MICFVSAVMGIGPRMLPMTGVSAVNVVLTSTTATQPSVGGAGHALARAGPVRKVKQTPDIAVVGPPAAGQPPGSVVGSPTAVACWAALARTASGYWLMIAVRPPSRAAFEIAL